MEPEDFKNIQICLFIKYTFSMLKKILILTLFVFISWWVTLSWNISVSTISSSYIWKIADSEYKAVVSLSNFGKTFWNNNYRGAMPTPATIKLLKEKYGVKTIITLLSKSQLTSWFVKAIKDNWMEWINVPMSKYAPKKAEWKKILAAFKGWNVFVHCKHGADRTGAIVARARIEIEWKNKDTAYKDMLKYNAKVEKIKVYKESFKYLKKFIYNWL